MRYPVWIGIACLLAFAAGFAAFAFLSGLPADFSVALWSPAVRWSASRAGNLFLSGTAFLITLCVVFVIYAVAGAAWDGAGYLASFSLDAAPWSPLGPDVEDPTPRRRLALQAVFVLAAGGAIVSGLLRNPLPIVALLVAALILLTVLVLNRAFADLAQLRTTPAVRSRASAIGGGQTEWNIAPGLILAVLVLGLVGGSVTLAALAMRPSPPAAREEVGKAPGETYAAPVAGSPGTKSTAQQPASTEK